MLSCAPVVFAVRWMETGRRRHFQPLNMQAFTPINNEMTRYIVSCIQQGWLVDALSVSEHSIVNEENLHDQFNAIEQEKWFSL